MPPLSGPADLTPPPSLPTGRLDLLVRAALLDGDEARIAWRAWRAVANLDIAPWNELRMLGVIAARIADLEPDAEIRPRVVGFRRKIWTLNQVRLQAAYPAVARLREAGIPLMLIKGSARVTVDPRAAQERFAGDIDALVPHDRQPEAAALLEAQGFTIDHVPWQRGMHAVGPISAHHAWAYRRGDTEIDLHNFAIPLNRLQGDDDRLWAASRGVTWRNTELRVPSSEHALLLAMAHGLRGTDGDPLADWTVDACRILDTGKLDWEMLLAEARDRLLQSIVHAGLTYLADVLHRPVPRCVLDSLGADRDEQFDAELADYASSTIARTEPAVRRAFAMAMRRCTRGKPLAEPTQVANTPAATVTTEFPPGGEAAWIVLPFDSVPSDWLVVKVSLELPSPALHGECSLRLLLPGLPVGSVPLVATAHAGPVWRHTLLFPFHRGLLASRAIDRIGIVLVRDNRPLLWPGRRTAFVELLAARAGG